MPFPLSITNINTCESWPSEFNHWPLVAYLAGFGFIFTLFAHMFSRFLVRVIPMFHLGHQGLSQYDKIEWHLRFAAIINAIQSFYFSFNYLYFCLGHSLAQGTLPPSSLHSVSIPMELSLAFSTGYWIADLLENLKYASILSKNDIIFHHLLSIGAVVFGTWKRKLFILLVGGAITHGSDTISHFKWFVFKSQNLSFTSDKKKSPGIFGYLLQYLFVLIWFFQRFGFPSFLFYNIYRMGLFQLFTPGSSSLQFTGLMSWIFLLSWYVLHIFWAQQMISNLIRSFPTLSQFNTNKSKQKSSTKSKSQ